MKNKIFLIYMGEFLMSKNTLRKTLLILLTFLMLFACACTTETGYEGQVKVVFCLEGGIYQNTTRDIVHYYPFEENQPSLISDPELLSDKKIEKAGYHIEGWYMTKTGEGENAEYSDKWNFSSDKLSQKNLTLYAKWVKNITFAYDVCYYGEQGEVIVLGTYPVSQGETFEDYAKFAKKRSDGIYTPLKYVDKNGNDWDYSFAHPGGEESLTIQVFVEYLKGDFALVTTAKELKSATKKNIYLLNDIDMQGEELYFENYKYEFLGNGHTVSNFKVKYDPSRSALKEDIEDDSKKSLYVSLFGNVDGAVISNVNFTGVQVEISTTLSSTYKIYLAPLGISAKNATVENVTFSGTYSVNKLPEGKSEELDVIVIKDAPFLVSGENLVLNGVTATYEKQA